MTHRNIYPLIRIFILAVFVIAVVGCSKVTQKNFDKIQAGMTYTEVETIIGGPTSCDSMLGMKQCTWKSGKKTIDIKFINEKVVLFSGQNL